jgi:hypothetical protein
VRFFRGIAVPATTAQDVISSISSGGLDRNGGKVYTWEKPVDPEQLFEKNDLSTNHTRGPRETAPVSVCACGDLASAAHYAWKHNKSGDDGTPVLIEIEVDPEIVAIDGRDFLYKAFQLGSSEQFRVPVERLFGSKVLRYADKAWNSNDIANRLALCDLAIHDAAVVRDHYKNKLIIGGGYYTKFRNAFLIKLPIDSACVVRVWTPTDFSELPAIDVNLYEILNGSAGVLHGNAKAN